MAGVVQEDGSSSVTTSSPSPLQYLSLMSISPGSGLGSPYHQWLRELKSEERGLCLIQLLLTCANHVAAGGLDNANLCLEQISLLAAADGDSMQRMAAYFAEALAGRVLRSWPGLYKALHSTNLRPISEKILARKLFFDLCPFLKASCLLSNQAILEAMEAEKMVHVVDLSSSEPAQWIAMMQAMNSRPEGPPHLRITCVHEHREVLEQTGAKLTEEAEKLDIPFQFHSVATKLESLDVEKLRVKTGEALAIVSQLELHSLLASDEPKMMTGRGARSLIELMQSQSQSPSPDSATSVPTSAKMDGCLSSLWGLSPKVMVVTEQESNHNGDGLMERLLEALYYYAALFDCLESTAGRGSSERMRVEKMLVGEEIKNIIGCEGWERKERHERLERWSLRLDVAGFANVPVSYYGMLQATRLLQSYGCDGYRMKEENGAVVICWHDRPLYSVSAWRCRR